MLVEQKRRAHIKAVIAWRDVPGPEHVFAIGQGHPSRTAERLRLEGEDERAVRLRVVDLHCR